MINQNEIETRYINGQYLKFEFSSACPDAVRDVLLKLIESKERVKIHYGNPILKEYWGDIDVGRIAYSTGMIKLPIMVYKHTSHGGGAILTGFIMKIESSRKYGTKRKVFYEVK